MNILDQPIAVPRQIHTYAELRQQVHDDLRTQHPEWVESNGESSMRLMELLDTLTRRASNESHRCSSFSNRELEGEDSSNMF
jgi:hypothetical protein